MLSKKLGHRLDDPLRPLITNSFLSDTSPIALTLTGLAFNIAAAGCIVYGYWKIASGLILLAGFFDMLDGAAARTMNKSSKFGGFIDSVVDRYSDMILVFAFMVHYSLAGNIYMICLCAFTTIGFVLVPYTRARAEVFIQTCNVGFMERAERILLIIVGCFFDIMKPVFWLLAVLSHITVLQRIYYTWKECRKTKEV